MPDDTNTTSLIEHCADYAQQNGIDAMSDMIAAIHQAYAPLADCDAARIAYEMAGIDLDDVEVEWVTLQ